MSTTDMSEQAIEARLDALGGLHRLGMSLADVDGPPLPWRVFDTRSLVIHGRASASVCAAVGLAVAGVFDVALLVGCAGKRHLVGDEFEIVAEPDGRHVIVEARCVLVGVTRQLGQACDDVAAGSKSISVVRFVAAIPPAIAGLPERNGWDGTPVCRLVKANDWRRRPR